MRFTQDVCAHLWSSFVFARTRKTVPIVKRSTPRCLYDVRAIERPIYMYLMMQRSDKLAVLTQLGKIMSMKLKARKN